MNNDYVLTTNDDGDLAIRTVSATESANVTDTTSVITRTEDGKLAVRTVGSGGGDKHNLGYFATLAELESAYPTGTAGDWAIVAESDTVYIWDDTKQEWVDTDQKGQVTSVNGQTGAVILTIPDAVQYSTMPTASADNLGDIVQFTGTTDANYTNGYFYKCVSDGQDPATYSWQQVDVQPAPDGLPDQTGNSGKFLTTNGTDASWSDKPLVNSSTHTDGSIVVTGSNNGTITGSRDGYDIMIGSNITGATLTGGGVVIGRNVKCGSYFNGVAIVPQRTSVAGDQIPMGGSVVIGPRCYNDSGRTYGVVIGNACKITTNGAFGIVLGGSDNSVTADYAIQIGGYNATNADANTFKVANANGNFEIMSADGTVPTARLTKVNTTATLAVADWSSNTQTITVSGVKADSVVFVSPAPSSASDYASAGILCTAQAADSLTFTCTTTPSSAITVNVICL